MSDNLRGKGEDSRGGNGIPPTSYYTALRALAGKRQPGGDGSARRCRPPLIAEAWSAAAIARNQARSVHYREMWRLVLASGRAEVVGASP
jgi:hypothetical protein